MSDKHCSKEEIAFLKARKSRQTASLQGERPLRKTHELHEFWGELHGKLSGWKEQLDLVVAVRTPSTTSQRKEAQNVLEKLSEQLVNLRRECLSELDVMEFPPTDVRLLHEELLKHAGFLDEAREKVSPKSNFMFKRYRQIHSHKLEKENLSSQPKKAALVTFKSLDKDCVKFGGTVVDSHSNATIVVESDGAVRIIRNDEPGNTGQVMKFPATHASSASILLQNLVDCTVFLHRSFQAVQIQRVNGGRVDVSSAIGGACHVSSCNRLHLKATAHQLRLHDSHGLSCSVHVTSSPILEDCTSVSFHFDPNDKTNAVSGAKDFNWLRNGIPSPNFSLVAIEDQGDSDCEYSGESDGNRPCCNGASLGMVLRRTDDSDGGDDEL